MTKKEYAEAVMEEIRAIEDPDERTIVILQNISAVSDRLARNLVERRRREQKLPRHLPDTST